MAQATPTASPQGGDPVPSAVLGWMSLLEAFVGLHQVQCDLLASWQQAAVELQKELFDAWVCRWAGGVPIDA